MLFVINQNEVLFGSQLFLFGNIREEDQWKAKLTISKQVILRP